MRFFGSIIIIVLCLCFFFQGLQRCCVNVVWICTFPLPETNIFASENWWLEDDPFLFGFGLFSWTKYVSYRGCTFWKSTAFRRRCTGFVSRPGRHGSLRDELPEEDLQLMGVLAKIPGKMEYMQHICIYIYMIYIYIWIISENTMVWKKVFPFKHVYFEYLCWSSGV